MTNQETREIRAVFDDETIRVYQAYNHTIADAAVRAQTFVAPFSFGRMTWIKPSFLWMMYRCGYARKDAGQERVLAVDVRRRAFDAALEHARLSHGSQEIGHVVVQWDPDRDLKHGRLPRRAIQIGIDGPVVRAYADEWIARITDVTELARKIGDLVAAGKLDEAGRLVPEERVYPATAATIQRLQMTAPATGTS